jgi:16S rRNA (cytosine1402-N4)-methyltransferase
MSDGLQHTPVLAKEVIEWLRVREAGVDQSPVFVDCTVGSGGHSEEILIASPAARVIGIDQDPEAIAIASERLKKFGDRVRLVQASFASIAEVLAQLDQPRVAGILADLGVSSMQLESGDRGFGFSSEGPLDMRMDQGRRKTAADLVNTLPERELADLIFQYGEESGARRIARALVKERAKHPIMTTQQLSASVVRALNVRGRWRIHPATRTFQALRIAVNDELNALKLFIPGAISALAPGGRLAVISFHSLEDRIVKQGLRTESGRCICPIKSPRSKIGMPAGEETSEASSSEFICERCGARKRVRVLTPKPIRPTETEVRRNPRSRSALLRVCEKV